jgi:hypothetical protein
MDEGTLFLQGVPAAAGAGDLNLNGILAEMEAHKGDD